MKPSLIQKFDHDPSVYVNESVCKDSFKTVYKMLEKYGAKSVLDIGCACGDFLHFMPSFVEKATGVDISGEVIEEAIRRNSKDLRLDFKELDVVDATQRQPLVGRFEAITILGTLQTFLNCEPFMDSVLALKPKWIIIHAPFNEEPVDSRHFHRDLTRNEEDFQCVFAVYSFRTIEAYLNKKKLKAYNFMPCEMSFDLQQDEKVPTRNYHIHLRNGQRFVTNGIGVIFKEYILNIEV